jgi:uncharacterized protein (TIRG00374 family)
MTTPFLKRKRTWGIVALSLGLGLIGLYLVVGEAIFRPDTYRLRHLSAPLALGAVGLLSMYWLFPAWRLRVLSYAQGHRLPFTTALFIHLAGLFSSAVTPSGSGSAPAIAAGFQRVGSTWGQGVSIAVQIMVLDFVFFGWILPLSLIYLIFTRFTVLPIQLVVLAIACGCLALFGAVVLGRYPQLAVRVFLWLARRNWLIRWRPRLLAAARDYYRSSRLFIQISWRRWFSLQLLSALSWLSSFALLWLLIRDHRLPLTPSLAILSVSTLLSYFVPTPGGAGFIEVIVGFGIGAHVDQSELAAPLLLWRLATFYLVFILGPLAAWLLLSGGLERITRLTTRTPPARRNP